MEFISNPGTPFYSYVPDWALIKIGNWYTDLPYDVSLRREPIIQTIDPNNWLTINRYGSRILNTFNLLMADFDIQGTLDASEWLKRRALLDKLAGKNGYRFEVYQTFGGFRVLETSRQHVAIKPDFLEFNGCPIESGLPLLEAITNDECYLHLCQKQQTFRHRLDPKPWREDEEEHVCTSKFVIGDAPRCPEFIDLMEAYDRTILAPDCI